jgi:uncharacterized protein YecE (DUF72 family)
VYAALQSRNVALCVADQGDAEEATPFVGTADWGYLRLRREAYDPPALAGWAARIREQPWTDAYVFFKHEDGAAGPVFAEALNALFR